MCIIVFIPTKAQRPGEAIINQCWYSNSHGAGLMYPNVERTQLIVDKGHMTLVALQEAFRKVPDGVPCCLHFRIATHGSRGSDMTHPHWIWPDEVAMVHNGVLPIGAPENSVESDSARFARLVLANFPRTWWKLDAMVHLVEEYMGRANKMIVLSKTGSYRILNESQGYWESGVWFSNQSFRPKAYSYSSASYSRYDADDYSWEGANRDYRGTTSTPGRPANNASGAQTPAGVEAGGSTPPVTDAAAASASSSATTPTNTSVGAVSRDGVIRIPGYQPDPVRQLAREGFLDDPEVVDLLTKSIGSMTTQEWNDYQELMESCTYGGAK